MTSELKSETEGGLRPKHIAIMVVVAAAVTLLGTFGIISFAAVPGVSAFYIAIGFSTAFCIWFGGWGVIGAAIGTTLAGIIGGTPLPVVLLAAITDGLLEKVLAAWSVRGLGMDPRLLTKRDWLIYILVCVLGVVVIPGAIFMAWLAAFGVMPWNVAFTFGLTSYVVGDILVILIITTALLKGLSAFVMRTQFYIKGWWA
jgi:hypothetical protein